MDIANDEAQCKRMFWIGNGIFKPDVDVVDKHLNIVCNLEAYPFNPF